MELTGTRHPNLALCEAIAALHSRLENLLQ